MKKIFFFLFFIVSISILNAKTEIDKAFTKRIKSNTKNFLLYSPDIYEGKQIREDQVYNGFDCNGKNISPKLVWKNSPVDTKSFAITMYDKDAKTGSGWWNWVVYNIPSNINLIDIGASTNKKFFPKTAIQGMNDYGEKKYGGVCPPVGNKHNYIITIYALNIQKLILPKNATPAMIALYINKHKIETATIKAYYKRNAEIVYKDFTTKKEKKIIYKNIPSKKTSKDKEYNLKSNSKKNTIVESKK